MNKRDAIFRQGAAEIMSKAVVKNVKFQEKQLVFCDIM